MIDKAPDNRHVAPEQNTTRVANFDPVTGLPLAHPPPPLTPEQQRQQALAAGQTGRKLFCPQCNVSGETFLRAMNGRPGDRLEVCAKGHTIQTVSADADFKPSSEQTHADEQQAQARGVAQTPLLPGERTAEQQAKDDGPKAGEHAPQAPTEGGTVEQPGGAQANAGASNAPKRPHK